LREASTKINLSVGHNMFGHLQQRKKGDLIIETARMFREEKWVVIIAARGGLDDTSTILGNATAEDGAKETV
jgi:hypothetical protein